jgi:hypothetical protein
MLDPHAGHDVSDRVWEVLKPPFPRREDALGDQDDRCFNAVFGYCIRIFTS